MPARCGPVFGLVPSYSSMSVNMRPLQVAPRSRDVTGRHKWARLWRGGGVRRTWRTMNTVRHAAAAFQTVSLCFGLRWREDVPLIALVGDVPV